MRILRSGQRRGITRTLKAMIQRRSAIEPAIRHMKMDGRQVRNLLKVVLGDALHAVMCGVGHLRMNLTALRLYCARLGLPLQAAHRRCRQSPTSLRLRNKLFRADLESCGWGGPYQLVYRQSVAIAWHA